MTGTTGKPEQSRRADVVRVLRDADGALSIADIAERLGVHPNTVRFHLETLEERGQVERVAPEQRTPGRPPLLFRAVRRMDPDGPRRYRMLAEVLVESLGSTTSAAQRSEEAGRSWWRRNSARFAHLRGRGRRGSLRGLVALLDELGFSAEEIESGNSPQIGLRSCPFLELATERSAVVCPVHLGLMQGALEEWGDALTVERLDPFVEPDLCVARLVSR